MIRKTIHFRNAFIFLFFIGFLFILPVKITKASVEKVNQCTAGISWSGASAFTGQIIEIPVSVTGINVGCELQQFQFQISYNNAMLSYEGYTVDGTIISNETFADDYSVPGTVNIFAHLQSQVATSGQIIRLKFKTLAVGISQVSMSNASINYSTISAPAAIDITATDASSLFTNTISSQVQEVDIYQNNPFHVLINGVNIPAAPVVTSLEFTVTFDPAYINFTGTYAFGGILASPYVEFNTNVAGELFVAIIFSNAVSGSGELINLEFLPVQMGQSSLQVTNIKFNTFDIASPASHTIDPQTVPVSGIVINDDNPVGATAETFTLAATVLPETASNKTVYWTSSNPDIASVEYFTGIVTGNKPGAAIITAETQEGGYTDHILVQICEPFEYVWTYPSQDEFPGTNFGPDDQCSVPPCSIEPRVHPDPPPGIGPDDALIITPDVWPEYKKKITLPSCTKIIHCTYVYQPVNTPVEGNEMVIEILDNGTWEIADIKRFGIDFTAQEAYEGTLYYLDDDPYFTEELNIRIKTNFEVYLDDFYVYSGCPGPETFPEAISIDYERDVMTKGSSQQLLAIIEKISASNQKVTWSSSDPDVISVNNYGLMTPALAKEPGTVTITATTENGLTASVIITVVDVDIDITFTKDEAVIIPIGGRYDFNPIVCIDGECGVVKDNDLKYTFQIVPADPGIFTVDPNDPTAIIGLQEGVSQLEICLVEEQICHTIPVYVIDLPSFDWTKVIDQDFEDGCGNFISDEGICPVIEENPDFDDDGDGVPDGSKGVKLKEDQSGHFNCIIQYNAPLEMATEGHNFILECDVLFEDLELGEGFYVEVFDGQEWRILKHFSCGVDFENNELFHATVYIPDVYITFTGDFSIRFRCDTSWDIDDIIFDNIELTIDIEYPVTLRGINVIPDKFYVLTGGTKQLSVEFDPSWATERGMTWDTDLPDIATVSSTGLVTGESYGNVTISGTSVEGPYTDESMGRVVPCILGDIDCDGRVLAFDAAIILQHYINNPLENWDITWGLDKTYIGDVDFNVDFTQTIEDENDANLMDASHVLQNVAGIADLPCEPYFKSSEKGSAVDIVQEEGQVKVYAKHNILALYFEFPQSTAFDFDALTINVPDALYDYAIENNTLRLGIVSAYNFPKGSPIITLPVNGAQGTIQCTYKANSNNKQTVILENEGGTIVNCAPNPFTHEVKFTLYSRANDTYRLTIYNATGQHISTLTGGLSKGINTIYWDASAENKTLSGGMYLYTIQTSTSNEKGTLIKTEK